MDGRQNKQTTEVPLRRRRRRRPWFPQRFFQPDSKHVCVPIWLFSLPPPTLLLRPAAASPPLSPPSAVLNAKATQRAAAELPHPKPASCLTPKTGWEVLHICNNNVISSYKRRTETAKPAASKKKKISRGNIFDMLQCKTPSHLFYLHLTGAQTASEIFKFDTPPPIRASFSFQSSHLEMSFFTLKNK